MKKNVLFFSRSGYYNLFCNLQSNKFNSFHAVMNIHEKNQIEKLGKTVVGCFEEELPNIHVSDIPYDFLQSGFYSDRFWNSLNLITRRELLGKMMTFWTNIIIKNKIDVCIHETISFEPEEVLTLIAKKYNCLDLTFLTSPLDGYFFFKPDAYSSKFSEELLSVIPSESDIFLANTYYNKVINKGHKPFYLDRFQSKRKLVNNIEKLKSLFSLIKHLSSLLFKKYLGRDLKNSRSMFYYDYKESFFKEEKLDNYLFHFFEYDKLEEYKDFKKVFFPLHYEPEATLLYFSPQYSNQANVIQEIAKNLPLDSILVVKEHPCQLGTLLNQRFQKLRENNSNIIFIEGEYDSFKLIEEIDIIITIVGSVGWEGIIKNKPTLILGNVFYDSHPNVIKVESYQEITDIIELEANKIDFSNNEKITLDFIAKLISLSHKGYYAYPKRDNLENYLDFTKAIEKEIFKNGKNYN